MLGSTRVRVGVPPTRFSGGTPETTSGYAPRKDKIRDSRVVNVAPPFTRFDRKAELVGGGADLHTRGRVCCSAAAAVAFPATLRLSPAGTRRYRAGVHGKPRGLTRPGPPGIFRPMSMTRILSILEAAQIEPPKAPAIAESLGIAFSAQEDDLTKRLMTKLDGAEIRRELEVKIEGTKAEIIKGMFLFWIGQVAATVAIVKFFIR